MILDYMRALVRSLCPAQWIYLLGLGFLALLALTGCGDTAVAIPATATSAANQNETVVREALPAVAVTTLQAPAGYPVAEANADGYPAGMTSGKLPAPVVVAQSGGMASDSPPPAPTAIATMTPVPTVEPAQTETETEAEVEAITPEAPPVAAVNLSASGEHFWLRRPVPQGGTVWTDKYYPYGGTRSGTLRPHHGVEFNVPYDTPIYAAAEGTIAFAGADDTTLIGPENNFYGNVVVVEHSFLYEGQAVYTVYGHLSEVYVNAGEPVNMDEPLGLSGATGVADGPHLHFEVRVGANSYAHTRNPVLWLLPFPGRGAIAGRVTDVNGNLLPEAPVSVLPVADSTSAFSASIASYAGTTVNADDRLQENFAFDDVPAGRYEVLVRDGEKKYKVEVFVSPDQTSFVEIVVGE